MSVDTCRTAATVTSDDRTDIAEISVYGRWSHRLGMQVCAGIRACLANPPAAVIADLTELIDPDGASMPLWLATRKAVRAVRPPLWLALCLPPDGVLHRRLQRLGPHHLQVFATMPEVRAAAAQACRVTSPAMRTSPQASGRSPLDGFDWV